MSAILMVFLFAMYFVPTFIASHRKHKNWLSIFLTNLFSGWTVLGWIACLVWSSSSHVEEKQGVVVNH